MSKTGEVPENEARLGKEKGSSGGFSGFMEDIKEKLSETKLHDAKVALIHKKYRITPMTLAPRERPLLTFISPAGTKLASSAIWYVFARVTA